MRLVKTVKMKLISSKGMGMSNKHLSLRVTNLNKTTWLYETKAGFELYADSLPGGVFFSAIIPWRKIRAALKRKDRKDGC